MAIRRRETIKHCNDKKYENIKKYEAITAKQSQCAMPRSQEASYIRAQVLQKGPSERRARDAVSTMPAPAFQPDLALLSLRLLLDTTSLSGRKHSLHNMLPVFLMLVFFPPCDLDSEMR